MVQTGNALGHHKSQVTSAILPESIKKCSAHYHGAQHALLGSYVNRRTWDKMGSLGALVKEVMAAMISNREWYEKKVRVY